MKKFVLCLLLSVFGAMSHASAKCSILYNTDAKLMHIMATNQIDLNFAHHDEICLKLKNANAGVYFRFESAITDLQTIALVFASLKDLDHPIESNSYATAIFVNQTRTTIAEKDALVRAVNTVLRNIDQQNIDSLNLNRKRLGFKTYPAN